MLELPRNRIKKMIPINREERETRSTIQNSVSAGFEKDNRRPYMIVTKSEAAKRAKNPRDIAIRTRHFRP